MIKLYFQRGGEMLHENKKYIIVGFGLCVLLMAACYWSGSGKDIPDNGAGVESVREQLGSAETTEREITEGIESAEDKARGIQERIERSEGGIREAEERADGIKENLNDAGAIIAECQRILENVRRRGEEKTDGN